MEEQEFNLEDVCYKPKSAEDLNDIIKNTPHEMIPPYRAMMSGKYVYFYKGIMEGCTIKAGSIEVDRKVFIDCIKNYNKLKL